MNKPRFQAFVSSLRLWSFPLTLMPMLVAACLIYKQVGTVDWLLLLLMVTTLLCVHAGCNLSNTFYDYINGVDGPGSSDKCLVEATLTTKQVWWMMTLSFGCSVLGIAMVLAQSPARTEHVLAHYIICVFIACNYTGGLQLKYNAIGEVTVLSARISVAVAIYASQGIALSWTPVLYTIPSSIISLAIMQSNNTRDMVNDAKAGITTLTLLIGKRLSGVLFTIFLLVVPYTAVCVLTIRASFWFVLPLLTLGPALKCWRMFYQGHLQTLPEEIAGTVSLPFGLLFLVACVLTTPDQLPGLLIESIS